MGVQEAGFGAGQDGPLEDHHPTPPHPTRHPVVLSMIELSCLEIHHPLRPWLA